MLRLLLEAHTVQNFSLNGPCGEAAGSAGEVACVIEASLGPSTLETDESAGSDGGGGGGGGGCGGVAVRADSRASRGSADMPSCAGMLV